MKTKNYLFAMLLSLLSTALVHADELNPVSVPVCDERHEVYPCILSKDEAGFEFVDMMIENIKGVKMVHSGGKEGLHVTSRLGTVTKVSSAPISNERRSPIIEVVKFEMKFSDHGGGDIDYPGKKWTVIKTTTYYGYVNKSTYQNTLESLK